MTAEQKSKCYTIIHRAAGKTSLVGAGLAQLPGSDCFIIVPLQIKMIIDLGKVFDITVLESTARALLASCIATIGGRSISQWLIGWMPGIGNIINAGTAAVITEVIGWIAVKDFENRIVEEGTKVIEEKSKLDPEINKYTGFVTSEHKEMTKKFDKERGLTDQFLKDFDNNLTSLIISKKTVNDADMTNLFTGRISKAYANIVIFDKDGNSKRLRLSNDKNTIGRTDEANINLISFDPDKNLSRMHAVIFKKDSNYYIEDLGSSNGTYINNKEIEPHVSSLLKDGDEIILGKVKFFFSMR